MKIINYIFILLISIGAMIPHSDFSQLKQINELSEHYEVHKSEALLAGDDIDLWDFLYIHFISGDEHEHDNADHEDLPFKQFTSGQNFYSSSPENTINLNALALLRDDISFYSKLFFDEAFLASIFQPPIV